jgi:hypothetical protein
MTYDREQAANRLLVRLAAAGVSASRVADGGVSVQLGPAEARYPAEIVWPADDDGRYRWSTASGTAEEVVAHFRRG